MPYGEGLDQLHKAFEDEREQRERWMDRAIKQGQEIARLTAENERLRLAEAEAMAVVTGLEGTVERLRQERVRATTARAHWHNERNAEHRARMRLYRGALRLSRLLRSTRLERNGWISLSVAFQSIETSARLRHRLEIDALTRARDLYRREAVRLHGHRTNLRRLLDAAQGMESEGAAERDQARTERDALAARVAKLEEALTTIGLEPIGHTYLLEKGPYHEIVRGIARAALSPEQPVMAAARKDDDV